MLLKNKTQREKFLGNYKKWGLWKEIPELELKFYRYAIISTGSVIIATESVTDQYSWNKKCYKPGTDVKYHLILSANDSYLPGDSTWRPAACEYRHFELDGISITSLVKYLTSVNPNIEDWLLED